MKHIASAFVVSLLTSCTSGGRVGTVSRITVDELDELSDYVLVDVRNRGAFVSGHAKGAISVPIGRIRGWARKTAPESRIILYCD